MRRYIDADKLMEQVAKKKPEVAKVRYIEGFNDAIMRVRSIIHSASTADVVEVRHGEWIFDFTLNGDDFYKCSVCGRQEVLNGLCNDRNITTHLPYCHCGAKMDGERRSENEG